MLQVRNTGDSRFGSCFQVIQVLDLLYCQEERGLERRPTDNGRGFTVPSRLERDGGDGPMTRGFYCDLYASYG